MNVPNISSSVLISPVSLTQTITGASPQTPKELREENRELRKQITKLRKENYEATKNLTPEEQETARRELESKIQPIEDKIRENSKKIKSDPTRQAVQEEVKDVVVGVASAYGVPAFTVDAPYSFFNTRGGPVFDGHALGRIKSGFTKPYQDLYFNTSARNASIIPLGGARAMTAINFAGENLPLIPKLGGFEGSWASLAPKELLGNSSNAATMALALPTLMTPPPEFHAYVGAIEANQIFLSRSDWNTADGVVFSVLSGASLMASLQSAEEANETTTIKVIADECDTGQLDIHDSDEDVEAGNDVSLTDCDDDKNNDGMGEPMADGVMVYSVEGYKYAKVASNSRGLAYGLTLGNGFVAGRIVPGLIGGGSRLAYGLSQSVINLRGADEATRITLEDIQSANRWDTFGSVLDGGEVGLDVAFNPYGNSNGLRMETFYALGDYRRETALEAYSRWNALLPHLDSSGANGAGFAANAGNRVFGSGMMAVRAVEAFQNGDDAQKTYILARSAYDFLVPVLTNAVQNGEQPPFLLLGGELLGAGGGVLLAVKRPDLFAMAPDGLNLTGNGLAYSYHGQREGTGGAVALSGSLFGKSASLMWSGSF